MIMARSMFNAIVLSWASFPEMLFGATGFPNLLKPIKADFSEAPTLLVGDLTFDTATFDPESLTQLEEEISVFTDPTNGDQLVVMQTDAPGHWLQVVDAITDPITVYGFGLVAGTGGALIAVDKLPEPITVTQIGQGILAPDVSFRFPISMVR